MSADMLRADSAGWIAFPVQLDDVPRRSARRPHAETPSSAVVGRTFVLAVYRHKTAVITAETLRKMTSALDRSDVRSRAVPLGSEFVSAAEGWVTTWKVRIGKDSVLADIAASLTRWNIAVYYNCGGSASPFAIGTGTPKPVAKPSRVNERLETDGRTVAYVLGSSAKRGKGVALPLLVLPDAETCITAYCDAHGFGVPSPDCIGSILPAVEKWLLDVENRLYLFVQHGMASGERRDYWLACWERYCERFVGAEGRRTQQRAQRRMED